MQPQSFPASNESTALPPVLMIRDVAEEVGARSNYQMVSKSEQFSDIIASGLLAIQDATTLLALSVYQICFLLQLTVPQVSRPLWAVGRIRRVDFDRVATFSS